MDKGHKHYATGVVIFIGTILILWPIFVKQSASYPVYMTFSSQSEADSFPIPMEAFFLQDNETFGQGSLIQNVPGPETWIIQLASFSEINNANTLVERLRHGGYNAYCITASSDLGEPMTRVLIGPETRYSQANRLIGLLQKDFNLHGMVLPYNRFIGVL